MIEEDYKVAEVEDDAPIAGLDNQDSTLDQDSQYDMEKQKQAEEFVKEDRIRAFQDLIYINKYARNCAENSQQRLLIAKRFKCTLPDPPYEPPAVEQEEEAVEELKGKAPAKAAKGKQEEVEEVEKSPEELEAIKMFEDFANEFTEGVDSVKTDMLAYKALTNPVSGVEKVGLWPKKLTRAELSAMKVADLAEAAKEDGEEKKRQEEAEAAASAKPDLKNKAKSKPGSKSGSRAGRGETGSQMSARSTKS